VKLPRGFLASGIRSGIRKKRPDLAVILADDGANAAAVFTTNRFQAAGHALEVGDEERG
jgi:glutamate N-acetyltransferase/amino-acid N-acetyltransferase